MDAVNRDILLMVLFVITSAGLAIAIVDDKKPVVYVSFLVSAVCCVLCFYLVSVR